MAYQSRLTRRLQRHRRLATLQRTASDSGGPSRSAASFQGFNTPDSGASTPVVNAVILPPGSSLPVGHVSVLGSPGLVSEAPKPTAAPQPQDHDGPPPISARPTPPVPASPPAAERLPVPDTQAEPDGDPKIWDRLKNIVRGHQDKKDLPEQTVKKSEAADPKIVQRDPKKRAPQASDSGGGSSTPQGDPDPPFLPPWIPAGPVIGGGGPPAKKSGDIMGNAEIGGSFSTSGPATVGGNLSVGGSTTIGGTGSVGGDAILSGPSSFSSTASIGGNVTAGADLSAGTSVDAGGNVEAGANLTAGTTITAGSNISASSGLSSEGNITAGANITPAGDTTIIGSAEAGAAIGSVGDLSIGVSATSGAALGAVGDVTIGGTASSGTLMHSSGDLDVGGAATVGAAAISGGDLKIEGSANIGAVAKAGGDLSVGGGVSIGGSAKIGGSINAGGPVTIAGSSNVTPAGGGGGTVQPKREEGQQPVPLQNVWPVQRKPGAPDPDSTSSETTPVSPQRSSEDVKEKLHDISPGRESESAIEWIPPRRPRPADAPTLIQRSEKSKTTHAPETAAATTAEVIPTEIGPLPADLWSLVGQRTPGPEKSRKETKEKRTEPAGKEEIPSFSNAVNLPEPATQVVQREADRGPESQETEDGSEEGAAEIDTDALAKKVYADIRRRLTIEFERMRRFF